MEKVQKTTILFIVVCFVIYSCITRYEQVGTEGYRDILVVEGIITNGTTVITLSKTIQLNDYFTSKEIVENATLYVESEKDARSEEAQYEGEGRYLIETPELEVDSRYRLKIILDGNEYQSDFLTPLITPELTTSFSVDDEGIVSVCVSTHDEQEEYRHFLWSFKENWEINSTLYIFPYQSFYFKGDTFYNDYFSSNNYFYCWKKDRSNQLYLASTEKFISNTISNHALTKIPRSDDKVSVLYCIDVKQNLIRKEAFRYFSNLQNNIERTGSIFTPIPFEVPGNITCVSNQGTVVIGYVDVSTTTEKRQFISREDVYVDADTKCNRIKDEPGLDNQPELASFFLFAWDEELNIPVLQKYWMNVYCLDCTYKGNLGKRGTKEKPDFWPNDHL